MEGGFVEALAEAVRAKRSPLVLGIDPRPASLPAALRDDPLGLLRFHERLIELCAPVVVGVKPQIAFFEALGVEGLELYARTCELARDAGLLVIGDVKRGDIASTAEAYARAHFARADALTVQPYLGGDSLEPFLDACRTGAKGVFVLCATSNEGAAEFQDLELASGGPLYLAVARAIAAWNEACAPAGAYGPVGAVVGGTRPVALAAVRKACPRSWLLVPGLGAQRAKTSEIAAAFDADGLGALVPVSRGLASCFAPEDPGWESKLRAKARSLRAELAAAVPALGAP